MPVTLSDVIDINGDTGAAPPGGISGTGLVITTLGTLSTVAYGSNGQVLTMVAGVPAWAAGGSGYATIERPNGTPVTQRAIVAFSTAFTATDATDTTNIDLAAGGIGHDRIATANGASIFGRSTNSTGAMAPILSSSDGQIVIRVGAAINFGQLAAASAAGTQTNGFTLGLVGGVPTWGQLQASAAGGVQTNGFVLTLVGGTPAWSAAPGGITGSGANTRVTFWDGATSVSSSAGLVFDYTSMRLTAENTGAGNSGAIRTSNTNSAAEITMSSQGSGVGGSFGGVTDQSTNMFAAVGTTKFGTTGSFPIYHITNNVIRTTHTAAGSFVLGTAAIATTATDGFLYITSCAGVPSGVPTAQTGRVAVVYDSTNNRIYAYNGAWRMVAVA